MQLTENGIAFHYGVEVLFHSLLFFLKGRCRVEQFQIITNNPEVRKKYADKYKLCYAAVSYLEIFILVRDLVQQGHTLLTHPLAGSIKPNETPYRTILVSWKPAPKLDAKSEIIIEDCIAASKKFPPLKKTWPPNVLEDFQYVDYSLISNVLAELN